MGVRGIVLEWFQSYLDKRQQYVEFHNERSLNLEIKCGIPQGSILGPLFSLLCIDDICNVSDKSNFILFADDTTIQGINNVTK